ncbi:MAG: 50S ribosomal protein L21 [Candidatus Kerfeldbacteria bacterium]|nr:50S ribosomal protein L21 [Candidatus Kerfeldbacteria bacterium]
MMAVIRTGGKQYLVSPGQMLSIEKLDTAVGQPVVFEQVLLVHDQASTVGSPLVPNAKVTGLVIDHGRARKVTSIKFHNKVRYRRKKGHRQAWTRVKIEKIQV